MSDGTEVDYDRVVQICEVHGINLPVDCIEQVVEIVRLAAGGAAQEPVADAVKLACESRDIEFDMDCPGATVGRLLLWERDNAAAPTAKAATARSMRRLLCRHDGKLCISESCFEDSAAPQAPATMALTDEQRAAIEWAIGMASQHNIHKSPLRDLLAKESS